MAPLLKKKLDAVVEELATARYLKYNPNVTDIVAVRQLVFDPSAPISVEDTNKPVEAMTEMQKISLNKWKSYYALVIQQGLVMAKLSILGQTAKDKNINIKESCENMMADIAAFQYHATAILGNPIEDVEEIWKEVDAKLQPILIELFMGPVEGVDKIN